MLRKLWTLLGSSALLVLVPCFAAGPAELRVTLESPKRQWLLGEPIRLRVVVHNASTEPIRSFKPFGEPFVEAEVAVHIAQDGRPYSAYVAGIHPKAKVARVLETLQSGDSWVFERKVLFAAATTGGLAIDQIGDYKLKAVYPVFLGGSPRPIESNEIQLRVVNATGSDARVWATINDRSALYFLHCGARMQPHEHEDPISKLTRILHDSPETTYHPAIRLALATYYDRDQFVLPPAEMSKLRRALLRREDTVLLDDARLDRIVAVVSASEQTPLSKYLKEMGGSVAVELHATPELAKGTISGRVVRPIDADTAVNLQDPRPSRRIEGRALMQEFALMTGGHWERRGLGYVLVGKPGASPRWHPSVLFPDDRRLGKFVDAEMRGRRLSEVLASLSQQSGVTLRPAEEFHGPWIGIGTTELRGVMFYMSQFYNSTWFPEGDGYVLRHNIPPERRIPTKMDVRK